MAVCNAVQIDTEKLTILLESQIEQRTSRRLRDLRVEVTPDRVVVHGYATSYYVKQLALQAVLDAVPAGDIPSVELDIEVGQSVPWATCRPSRYLES